MQKDAPTRRVVSSETRILSRATVEAFHYPSFQRDYRYNRNVKEFANRLLEDGGIIHGTVTLGVLDNDVKQIVYVVDAQHRLKGFLSTPMPECIAQVTTLAFADFADMAREFVTLNGRIRPFTPDHVLKAAEEFNPHLRGIREQCPCVGYGSVRTQHSKQTIGMSVLLRCWAMSRPEVPSVGIGSAADIAKGLTDDDENAIVDFICIAIDAWGAERENKRLWGQLNMTLCMWLFRRLVLDLDRSHGKKRVVLDFRQFKRCLMQVASDQPYKDWLAGKLMNERDRSPGYNRICEAFMLYLKRDRHIKSPMLPSPAWAS